MAKPNANSTAPGLAEILHTGDGMQGCEPSQRPYLHKAAPTEIPAAQNTQQTQGPRGGLPPFLAALF